MSQYLQVLFFLVRLGEWLCFLWSREELRRSRLFLSRLRLRFSRLRLPRSLLQLRCLSPRPGDPLRLLFLCRSLSRSCRFSLSCFSNSSKSDMMCVTLL